MFNRSCFQDPTLQELLPFGEYVPPDNCGIPVGLLGMEAWDMDRLLQRLALQNGPNPRHSRSKHRSRPFSMPGSDNGETQEERKEGSMNGLPATFVKFGFFNEEQGIVIRCYSVVPTQFRVVLPTRRGAHPPGSTAQKSRF